MTTSSLPLGTAVFAIDDHATCYLHSLLSSLILLIPPPPLPPRLPKAPVVPVIVVNPPQDADMGDDVKQALLEMANSFREIGQTAKQNNTNFLGDIPYFGIPPAQDKRKSIIPLGEPNRFLNLVDTVTERADFTVAGKIGVLKSKLLGPAQEHWSDYNGGDN